MTPEQALKLKRGDIVTLRGTSPGTHTGHSDYDSVGKVERGVMPGDEPKTAFGGAKYYWINVRVGGHPQVWPTNRVVHGAVARPLRTGHH